MLRLGDDVSAGTVRGETSVVTSVIAPPTDVTPVVINGHVLAKDGLVLSTGFNASLTCKKVINTTGSLTLQGDGANVVTIDANGTISNSGGLNSTGDVSCANVNFTGALGLNSNYGTSGQLLTSQGAGNSPVWSNSTFTGNLGINSNLTFDRGNNNTSLVRFTSSTGTGTAGHTPTIHVGDIETSGRMGFDFKFRDGGINNSTFTLFRAFEGGTTGNGQFQVFGATYSAQGWNTSDDRFKHGEYNIANGLETIRQLVPQTYKKTIKMLDANNDGTNIGEEGKDWFWESGLIAQEIEKIPTLSKYVKDLDNRKYVSYNNIHIHTIAAVKELDTLLQKQAQLISSLEARLLALESK